MSAHDFVTSPYHRALGIEIIRMEAGKAEIHLPLRNEF